MSRIADFIIDLAALIEQRREERHAPDDVGTKVIDLMAKRCLTQRRMIGPEVSATVSSHLEIAGERFTLSLTMHAVGEEVEL